MVPARVETVVLFLPDVWSCIPTRLEWDNLHINYGKQLDRKLKAAAAAIAAAQQQQQQQPEVDDQTAAADEKASTSYIFFNLFREKKIMKQT